MHLSSHLLQAELRARGTCAERQKRNKNSIAKKSSGIVLTPLPSVRPSVRLSVCPSIRPFDRPSELAASRPSGSSFFLSELEFNSNQCDVFLMIYKPLFLILDQENSKDSCQPMSVTESLLLLLSSSLAASLLTLMVLLLSLLLLSLLLLLFLLLLLLFSLLLRDYFSVRYHYLELRFQACRKLHFILVAVSSRQTPLI